MSACILAVADEYQERLRGDPGQPDADPKDILKGMQSDAGTLFSRECVDALAQELGASLAKPPRSRAWPAGLTNREVEVLQLVATGASNRQIAARLVISEQTVKNHVSRVLKKLNIKSRHELS